jgi:uncharacterized protein (TIGR02246 family)
MASDIDPRDFPAQRIPVHRRGTPLKRSIAQRRLRATIVAVGHAVLVGCASGGSRATPSALRLPDERARIEAATQHYAAVLRGAPVDSVVAVYAEDGELVLPGVATLHGRKTIRDFLAPLAANVTVSSVEMHVDSIAVSGNSAVERGRYRQVAGPTGGAAQEFRGAFDATWTRGPDAQWRLARLVMRPGAKTP